METEDFELALMRWRHTWIDDFTAGTRDGRIR
jgi:hypothetical protein